MTRHPAAHDPALQDKIDKLCDTPYEWKIIHELERSKDNLEYNIRMVRALNREMARIKDTIDALEIALKSMKELRRKKK